MSTFRVMTQERPTGQIATDYVEWYAKNHGMTIGTYGPNQTFLCEGLVYNKVTAGDYRLVCDYPTFCCQVMDGSHPDFRPALGFPKG